MLTNVLLLVEAWCGSTLNNSTVWEPDFRLNVSRGVGVEVKVVMF